MKSLLAIAAGFAAMARRRPKHTDERMVIALSTVRHCVARIQFCSTNRVAELQAVNKRCEQSLLRLAASSRRLELCMQRCRL